MTQDDLLARTAVLARELRLVAIERHLALRHPETWASCPDERCMRTWEVLEGRPHWRRDPARDRRRA